jgi:hypothetical protein
MERLDDSSNVVFEKVMSIKKLSGIAGELTGRNTQIGPNLI